MQPNQVSFFVSKIEKRSVGEGTDKQTFLEGRACPYNEWSQPICGYFLEKFLPGSFTESIGKRNIFCTVDHDIGRLLGRTSSGTLKIEERDDGLYASVAMPNTTYAADLLTQVDRGDVAGMSFDFVSVTETWGKQEGMNQRTISKAELFEVCFTPDPAYLGSTANLAQRSLRVAPIGLRGTPNLDAARIRILDLDQ